MKALIDADSLLYKVCFAIEDKTIWNEFDDGEEPLVEYTTDLEQCYTTLDTLIENIMFATETEEALLVLTGKGNFRESNPLGYKAHRKDLRKPLGMQELKEYMQNKYEVFVAEGYEADDYVVYQKTTYPDKWFLCAIDKDVLYQTPGYHYNYGKDMYVEVSEKKAMYFMYYQCLVGDTSDGYKGCPGIGDKKAKALLKECKTEEEVWLAVVKTYEEKGLTKEDAINTMRLCSMHQLRPDGIELWNTFA